MRHHQSILARNESAILVVDVQERLAREVVESERVLSNVAKLVEAAGLLNVPVLVTEHNADAFGPTAKPVQDALGNAPVVPKMIFSCLAVEKVQRQLAEWGRRQLIVAGLETHICVCQTALDALESGFEVHVVRDGCSSRKETDHHAGLEKMLAGGVLPCTWEMAVFELLERAGTGEFRSVLPLIKAR